MFLVCVLDQTGSLLVISGTSFILSYHIKRILVLVLQADVSAGARIAVPVVSSQRASLSLTKTLRAQTITTSTTTTHPASEHCSIRAPAASAAMELCLGINSASYSQPVGGVAVSMWPTRRATPFSLSMWICVVSDDLQLKSATRASSYNQHSLSSLLSSTTDTAGALVVVVLLSTSSNSSSSSSSSSGGSSSSNFRAMSN